MADYEDTKVKDLIINNMSQEKFDELAAAGELDPTQVYLTPTKAESGGSVDGIEFTTYGVSIGKNIQNSDGVCIGTDTVASESISIGYAAQSDYKGVSIGVGASAGSFGIALGGQAVAGDTEFVVNLGGDNLKIIDDTGLFPRERLSGLVEVLPTADNGYTTVKNFGNNYVEITGYASIGTVGAGTGSEIQVDLPAGYTMADANYWVNIAPTSETTMFDLKAEAKARSTTHFMVAYKNEDDTTGLTNAGVYWEIRGMLATE